MRRVTAILFALPIAAALCPQGAVQGTRPEDCYLYGASQSWQKAEAFCASNKGHLSSVPNALVNAFIASYLKPLDSAQSYWLGAELKSAADKWTWTDGSSFTYTMWAAGEPKQGSGCLYMDAPTGQWHSGDCDASKPFICKVPSSCKPAPQKCEDGWTFNEKLNKCYKTLSGLFNWDSAQAACRNENAYLPSIHDDQDNIAFADVARRFPYVVLGLKNTAWTDSDKNVYNFAWADGSFFDYSKLWADGGDDYADCAFFENDTDQWITKSCDFPGFMATAICQKSPNEA